MSEVFSYVKSPLEPAKPVLPFPDAAPPARSEARTDGAPSGEIGLTFSLTEAQRAALSFAALCEAESLEKCREKHEPEVQEAVRSLYEARFILEQGRLT